MGTGYLFGVPVGGLGWFATLLVSVASGFMTFFLGTFFGIFGILFANTILHRTIDFSVSYRLIGLPAGVLVLVLALLYLGSLWIKRMLRRQ
jgi:ABC-type dipeptide/oligopeptide/nickel transport system permease component